ncbi:MAG: hypothetical protein LBE50_03195 [Gallionellaceae bacterium]|nr:hypothetical protein [Gallionellaceae bacterium]
MTTEAQRHREIQLQNQAPKVASLPSFQRKLESSAFIKILRRSRQHGFVRYAECMFLLDSSLRWNDGRGAAWMVLLFSVPLCPCGNSF